MLDWSASYVGIPWLPKGRERASGVDCWGLVRLVYAEQLGKVLPALLGRYDDRLSSRAVAAVVDAERNRWTQVEAPQPFDVALFHLGSFDQHVAVIVNDELMIHAKDGFTSCLERYCSGMWAERLSGFYRHA